MSLIIGPLWQLDATLLELLDSAELCEESLRPELEQKIAAYVEASIEKVDRIDAVLASLDSVASNAKNEITRLTERRQSAERAAERLKDYILRVILSRDGRPLKGRNVTFATRSSEAVVIDDPNQIADQYKRVTIVTDVAKIPIRDAIKSGLRVAGARLETRQHLVRK